MLQNVQLNSESCLVMRCMYKTNVHVYVYSVCSLTTSITGLYTRMYMYIFVHA